jgi:hypothetical protein
MLLASNSRVLSRQFVDILGFMDFSLATSAQWQVAGFPEHVWPTRHLMSPVQQGWPTSPHVLTLDPQAGEL